MLRYKLLETAISIVQNECLHNKELKYELDDYITNP